MRDMGSPVRPNPGGGWLGLGGGGKGRAPGATDAVGGERVVARRSSAEASLKLGAGGRGASEGTPVICRSSRASVEAVGGVLRRLKRSSGYARSSPRPPTSKPGGISAIAPDWGTGKGCEDRFGREGPPNPRLKRELAGQHSNLDHAERPEVDGGRRRASARACSGLM